MENAETNNETSTAATEGAEVLVVMSKVKKFVRDHAEMNTAGNVGEILSDKVRALLTQAIERAKADGRKTVKDRDFL